MLAAPVAAAALFGAPGRASAAIYNDVLPGARAMGMGTAYTAVADDPYGMFYNPAGLAGSDFTQLGGGLGRMLSPLGSVSYFALAYGRPLPVRPGSTFGAAFFGLRQNDGGDKDEFLLHYSEAFRVPVLRLARPLKLGGNVRFLNVDGAKGERFGVGMDAGMMLETKAGLKSGLSVTSLTTEVGAPNPSMNLGLSYLFQDWLLLASDMRVRPRLTEFYPGLEAAFYQGMLKARLGKGLRLDGVSQWAFGFGVNFSPVLLDFAASVPFNGFNRPGGGYQASLNYKFDAPPFYGRFIGTAARQAEDLRSELLMLEDKKKTLQAQALAAESDRDAAQGQLNALGAQLTGLQDTMRELERRAGELGYQAPGHKTPAPEKPARTPAKLAPAPKPPEPFPRQHAVAPGDTLRSIANQHYGNPDLWETIYNANPDRVERGLPQEGSILTIPAPQP